jgi:hypothetical protein
LNKKEWDELTRELARDDYDDGLYRALLGERIMGLHAFDHPEVAADGDTQGQNRVRWPTRWMSRDRAYYLQHMRRVIAASQDTWPEKWNTSQQLHSELEQFIHTSGKLTHIQHMFSMLLLPAQQVVFGATGRIRTQRKAAIVAVAIEQFRKQTGELPGSLDDLTPDFIESIPADPFNGQALRYRIEPDQYLVYGIGDNGQDDGGTEKNAIDHVISIRRVAPAAP